MEGEREQRRRREERPGREEKEEGERRGTVDSCRGSSSVARAQAGGVDGVGQGQPRSCSLGLNQEDKATFVEIPLAFGVFWEF
jgi:hypothetical protein